MMVALSTAGWASIDDVPIQHIVLFLPWIHYNLQKEKIMEHANEFGLNDEQKKALLSTNAIKDDDKHIRNVFKVYMELFKDEKIARNIARWFLNSSKSTIVTYLLFNQVEPDAFHVYKTQILEHPTRRDINIKISAHLPIAEMVKALKEHQTDPSYQMIAEDVKPKYENGGALDYWSSRCELFIQFIALKPKRTKPKDWLLEFLSACSYHPKTRPFASYIDREYKDKLEEYRISLQTQDVAPSQFTADLVINVKPPTSPRPQDSEEFKRKRPSTVTGECSANAYILYPYQVELVGPAKNNKNTIICAPTGSGKTLMAADIIAHHLRTKRHHYQIGRAVMFVPTVPLVEQQSQYIKNKIGMEFHVEKMSGNERIKSSDERLVDILVGDGIVMTPQIFINMLLSPLKSQRIYLTDFTLMIFDECHHCAESHPYNVVMDYVRNATIKPQIVGLTASTGSGKANTGRVNHENTIEHIIGLCARLTAVTVCSVKDKKNLEDLMSRISQPVDDFISVPHPHKDEFAHAIAKLCDYVENKMHSDLKELMLVNPNLNEDQISLAKEEGNYQIRNGQAKTNFIYFSKMAYITNEVSKNLTEMNDKRLFVLKCLHMLNMLYYTLKYNELFPACLAMKYLVTRFEEFKKNDLYYGNENVCPIDPTKLQTLRDIYYSVKGRVKEAEELMVRSEDKPILGKLMEILQEQFHQEPSSRVIIFVEMRRIGADLANYLSQRPEITSTFGKNKVGYITSTNQASSQFGQTANEQKMMLERFKNATLNILVATSVAEEGLDVAACNLIVKYNSVGSEKSLTQRKGRARAKNSRAVLLALDEKTMSREFDNLKKEFIMNVCIQHLQTMSEMELQQRIKVKNQEIQELANYKKKQEEEKKSHLNEKYRLHCYECAVSFCKSDELFSLNNNEIICCNSDCWKATTIEKKVERVRVDSISIKCGSWFCHCGRQRGSIIKYGGVFLPSISSNSFILKTMDDKPCDNVKSRNWESYKNLFSISPIGTSEIRTMAASLYNYSRDLFNQVEENEKLCLLASIKDHKKNYLFEALNKMGD